MDKSFNKFLKYINKNNIVSLDDFENKFKLNTMKPMKLLKLCKKIII